MKALKCIGCKSYVVVSDGTIGFCGSCRIELQRDKNLDKELKLTKDEAIKAVKIKNQKLNIKNLKRKNNNGIKRNI